MTRRKVLDRAGHPERREPEVPRGGLMAERLTPKGVARPGLKGLLIKSDAGSKTRNPGNWKRVGDKQIVYECQIITFLKLT